MRKDVYGIVGTTSTVKPMVTSERCLTSDFDSLEQSPAGSEGNPSIGKVCRKKVQSRASAINSKTPLLVLSPCVWPRNIQM